jgi:hypothetical protein
MRNGRKVSQPIKCPAAAETLKRSSVVSKLPRIRFQASGAAIIDQDDALAAVV